MITMIYAMMMCLGDGSNMNRCRVETNGDMFVRLADCQKRVELYNRRMNPRVSFFCVKRPLATWEMAR